MTGKRPSRRRLPPEEVRIILDSVTEGVFTVDKDLIVTSFNRAAEEITGVSAEEVIEKPCCEPSAAGVLRDICFLKETLDAQESIFLRQKLAVTPDGKGVPLSISTAVLRDERGKVVGAVETFRDLSVVEDLRRELTKSHSFHDIISKSHQMRSIFELLPRVAESDSTVLIEGPSGSGKELVARAIHDLSFRSDQPLVTVNCGALPDTLLESELFGHVRGAFTDAKTDRKGRFAMADGGSIFLDEIGDVSPALQVRLLRVLQERTYEPVGSSKSATADVRVITATNKDLREEIRAGRFRDDLFYRLNVMRLEIPTLAARREDIPLLADHFISRFNRLKNRQIAAISDEAMQALMRHDWPGNVRELENAVEHSFILCQGPVITIRDLPAEIGVKVRASSDYVLPTDGMTLEQVEAHTILSALKRHGWRRMETARELGINKTTLWRKMKRLGVEAPDSEGE